MLWKMGSVPYSHVKSVIVSVAVLCIHVRTMEADVGQALHGSSNSVVGRLIAEFATARKVGEDVEDAEDIAKNTGLVAFQGDLYHDIPYVIIVNSYRTSVFQLVLIR